MITVTATLKRSNGNGTIYYKEDGRSKNYTGHWTGRDGFYKINRFPEKGQTFENKEKLIEWIREEEG